MSYSDLLAHQDKELEQLNKDYYADRTTIQQLQNEHYDKARFAGQLDRLRESHERNVKDLQARFAHDQRGYLGEPAPPIPLPDISQSQNKAAEMIKSYRQQQARSDTVTQPDSSHQHIEQPQTTKGQPIDEVEVKKLARQTREKREEKTQQRRRSFRR